MCIHSLHRESWVRERESPCVKVLLFYILDSWCRKSPCELYKWWLPGFYSFLVEWREEEGRGEFFVIRFSWFVFCFVITRLSLSRACRGKVIYALFFRSLDCFMLRNDGHHPRDESPNMKRILLLRLAAASLVEAEIDEKVLKGSEERHTIYYEW